MRTYKDISPPPLMVEALQKRYPTGVWLATGNDHNTHCVVYEYCDEYKATGYVSGGIFHIVTWGFVTPQSKDRMRLDEALRVLGNVYHQLDDKLNEVQLHCPDGGFMTLEDAIDGVLNGWSE